MLLPNSFITVFVMTSFAPLISKHPQTKPLKNENVSNKIESNIQFN